MRTKSNVIAMLLVVAGCLLCAGALAQERDFQGWEESPGLHFYLVQDGAAWAAGELTVLHTPVRDHVSGTNALKLEFPESKQSPGVVLYKPPGVAVHNRVGYSAISFWVKGDGSEGIGVIGIGAGRETDPRAKFRLSDKTWQPVRLSWTDFDHPVVNIRIESFFFTVTPETKRPTSYLVDRIELARSVQELADDDKVREAGAKAEKLPDKGVSEDLSGFISAGENLDALRARIAQKKSLRILVLGDAVSQGAGLWNIPAGARGLYLYWGRAVAELRKSVPEVEVFPVFADGPEDAASRAAAMMARTQANLVIVQFSGSPPGVGRPGAKTAAAAAIRRIFEAAKAAKVPVIAVPVPPLIGPLRRLDFAEMLSAEAKRAHICLADMGKLAGSRGLGFEGEFYATPEQLNVQGHAAVSKMLLSILKP